MKAQAVVDSLASLAQEHRLKIFRLLVTAGERGLSAGAIAGKLAVPNSSLSFHLAFLTKAGMIRQERQSRFLIYRADFAAMNALLVYLSENCCGGEPCGTVPLCELEEA